MSKVLGQIFERLHNPQYIRKAIKWIICQQIDNYSNISWAFVVQMTSARATVKKRELHNLPIGQMRCMHSHLEHISQSHQKDLTYLDTELQLGQVVCSQYSLCKSVGNVRAQSKDKNKNSLQSVHFFSKKILKTKTLCIKHFQFPNNLYSAIHFQMPISAMYRNS